MTALAPVKPSRPCKQRRALVCALAVTLVSSLPAGAALAAPQGVRPDPFEGVNRAVFAFNQFLDHVLIRPAAIAYQRILPNPVRTGLRNAAINLGEPSVAVNDILQGRASRGIKTAARFTLNTTLGVFGFFDFARRAGLAHHPNDFGVTLARFGVGSGPYLVIPLAGPNTVRDAIGELADLALNPLAYARYTGDKAVGIASVVTAGLDMRAGADQSLKALEASATDPYASLRSFWLQNRASEISGGRIDLDALPDFGADPSVDAKKPDPSAAPSPNPAAEASQGSGTKASPRPGMGEGAMSLRPADDLSTSLSQNADPEDAP